MRGKGNATTGGLLTQPIDPEDADRARFVSEWAQRNPESIAWLRRMTKEELIALYIRDIVGSANDNERSDPYVRAITLFAGAAHETYLKGTQDEARKAVEDWRDSSIAAAGKNIPLAVAIAQLAGEFLAAVRSRTATKAIQARSQNLGAGRKKGAKTQADSAAKNQARMIELNNDLSKNATTVLWNLDKRAAWIADELKKEGIKQPNGKPYSKATIKTKITGSKGR